jgi:hypothetical protein
MATNGSFSSQDQYKSSTEQYPATSGPADSSTASGSGNDLSKDEVGWYFVEQYYTTLSKSPEKLHVSSTYLYAIRCWLIASSSSMASDPNSSLVLKLR